MQRRERRGQPDAYWEAQRSRLDKVLFAGAGIKRHFETDVDAITEISTLLKESFKLKEVDSDAPLMKAGLRSIDLPVLVDALNAAFDMQLPPTLVLECGTVRGIAERLVLTSACRPCACGLDLGT